MRKGEYAVDCTGMPLGRNARNALGRVVDAPDGIDDPHFVARADTSISAAIAVEGRDARCDGRGGHRRRMIRVGHLAGELRRQVVRMNPIARRDRRGGRADRHAVLDDALAGCVHTQRDLVAGFHVQAQHNGDVVDGERFAVVAIAHEHSDGVVGMHTNRIGRYRRARPRIAGCKLAIRAVKRDWRRSASVTSHDDALAGDAPSNLYVLRASS